MRLKFLTVLTFVLAQAFFVMNASAQSGAPGPGGGPPPPLPQTLDLATAKKVLTAAEAAATTMNVHAVICVMDSNGDVVAFERMDMAGAIPLTSSQGKARAAVLFGLPTSQVADAIRGGKPITATLTPPPMGASGLMIQQGGLPIIKTGKVIGAIGVGGSSPANDEKVAQAGLDALIEK
jgi:glc operon protein GlcG